MGTVDVTLRMEKGLKERAEQLFSSLGISFSAAVSLFVREALRTQGIPFEVSMRATSPADGARLSMFESLITSPEALRRLSEIGEGSDWSYDSLTSVEEAREMIDSIKGRSPDTPRPHVS